jgi:acyl-CoA dehydrogenase
MARLPTELVALTDEQEEIVRLCRQFARDEIRPVAREVDEADVLVPWEIWGKAAAIGLTSFMLPQELGGGGFGDVFTQCLVQEELCAGDLAIGNLLTSNGFFAHPVLELGTAEQKERFLSPLVGPSPPLTALAVTEPDVGSDAASLQTRAVATAGGYRLTGRKTWISNAGPAELYVVFAPGDPARRARGVTAFVMARGAEGLSFSQPFRKMGQRALVNAEMILEDVFVPEADRLGDEGQGFLGLMQTFDASRVVLGASATGVARAATEYAVEYAAQRRQFGKPIIEHQAVAFRLADMVTRVEAARLMVWRAARRLDAGLRATTEAAMAKLVASETAMFATWAAVQTLGGWGYSREYLVEKWMRDAKLEEIEEGTSDIQRLVISRDLTRS